MNEHLIKLVVADDHPLFRRGVVELLNDSEEMEVIAEYDNGFSLLENLDQNYPDILLLDLQMPGKTGLELLRDIRQHDNDLKILIITACDEQEKLLDALRHGANGYLQKDTPPDEILGHLLRVAEGKVALNIDAITSLATHIREDQQQQTSIGNKMLSELTERERETLLHISSGLNNKLIARELNISDGTVKVYVKSLLRKLNVNSRLELAAWAHQNLTKEELSQ
jgi:two-component system nitrate/nitrite response regulator NarL